jgi:hypothetical protein
MEVEHDSQRKSNGFDHYRFFQHAASSEAMSADGR